MKLVLFKLFCIIVAVVVAVAVVCLFDLAPIVCVYEASSGFYYGVKSHLMTNECAKANDSGSAYVEMLNDRLQKWSSDRVKGIVIDLFGDKYRDKMASEEELRIDLAHSRIKLKRNARNCFQIIVRSSSPKVCAGLANAYVEAISMDTDEENRIRNGKAVAQIHAYVEHSHRVIKGMRRKLIESSGSSGNVDEQKALASQLKAELDQLEKLRQLEITSKKAAECSDMAVVFAWRAEVPKWPVGFRIFNAYKTTP